MTKRSLPLFLFALPALVVFLAFFCLPMARLIEVSVTGKQGAGVYWTVLTSARYLHSRLTLALRASLLFSAALGSATAQA